MSSITYDRDTPAGNKLANTVVAVREAAADVAYQFKVIQQSTMPMTSTTAGDLKEMLEEGFAATVVEMTVTQDGSSPGNVSVGDTYTGDTSGATGKILWQDDTGSVAHMVLLKVSGTFQDGEGLTNSGSNTNTATINTGTLNLTPGDGDNKYPGEKLFGVAAGSGAAFYSAVSALNDEMDPAVTPAAQLYQGD